MLPMALGVLMFNLIPIVQSLIYSFFDYDMMNTMDFIGFDNYVRMFTVDLRSVMTSLWATFSYLLISLPLGLVLSYMFALLLNSKLKGMGVFRVLAYLPNVIPPIASALLWRDLFDPKFGILNAVLKTLNLPTSQWLSAPESALGAMIFMSLWGVGGGMILWLAAFKNIPESLYEAAKIDGANSVVLLFRVTIPMTTPMIFYNLLNGIIGGMQVFASFLMTTSNEMPDSIYFYAVRIYNEAFGGAFNMGYACSLAWLLFLIIGVMSASMFKFNKWVFFAEDN